MILCPLKSGNPNHTYTQNFNNNSLTLRNLTLQLLLLSFWMKLVTSKRDGIQ